METLEFILQEKLNMVIKNQPQQMVTKNNRQKQFLLINQEILTRNIGNKKEHIAKIEYTESIDKDKNYYWLC